MLLPKVERLDVPASFFEEEKFTFEFPQDRFIFIDYNKIQVAKPSTAPYLEKNVCFHYSFLNINPKMQSHSLSAGDNMLEEELPSVPEELGTD